MSAVEVGDILDSRYRIDTPIARGGMSTVYRCVDLRLGRQVAAKIMDDRYLGDPVFRTRFEREARSMAQLSHPNVVNVYDFSSSNEHAFLIMELITGGTLRELLADRGPMPPHAATAVMRALLTGLAAAHKKGMVHRDIKPDNVLINADHRVKLADFGLVRAVAESERTSDQIIGTVSYLSPEQVEGTSIGPASDVYSAGILLFELLTGQTPFSGDTQLAHAMARLSQDVPPPSSRIAGVPRLFDELVAAATQRNPEDRFATAAEFLDALEDVARELDLPPFKVPVPRNAAAARATSIVSRPTPPASTYPRISDESETSVVEPATQVFDQPRQSSPLAPPAQRAESTKLFPAAPVPPPAAPAAPVASPQPHQVHPISTDDIPPPVSNRGSFKVIVWLVIVGILLAAVAVGGWWFGSGRYGEIPQVLGLDETAAIREVSNAGFVAATAEKFSDEVPNGKVIGTDPPFNQRAPRGSQVAVLVSVGKPTVPAIPTTADTDRYRQLLAQRTLRLGLGMESYSDDVPVGGIVSVSPQPGVHVNVGSTVTASLSKGPAPVDIPDVSGMTEDKARAALQKVGLQVVGVDHEFSANHSAGTVLDVTPPAHTKVVKGSEVRLKVSNAQKIPDVSGMKLDDAQAKLQELGLTVHVSTDDVARDKPSTVVEILPRAGTVADPTKTIVELKVNRKIKVANVVGKSPEHAESILREQGLTPHVVKDGDLVVRQSPRARSEVEVGETIEIGAW